MTRAFRRSFSSRATDLADADQDVRWVEKRPTEDYHRILEPDGTPRGSPPVEPEGLLRWYRTLIETRALEALCLRMQRRGELSVAATSRGEEAVGVGAASALQPGDWCFPSYRQTSALLYWGAPVERMIAALRGAPPEHIAEHLPLAPEALSAVRFVPYAIFLGSSLPNAVGCALADQLNERPVVTLAFVGDGATSEGDFYDAINFAGVFATPLVIVIQNNGWSISVPAHRQTAARTFADKAVAAGLSHSRVDGNDILAIYDKTREAVERARGGGGTTLIEAVTYRLDDHNTADAASLYRREEEVAYWETLEPIRRFERYLERTGLLDDVLKQQVAADAGSRLRAAIKLGRAVPPAPAELMFAHHLIDRQGWAFQRGQRELECELRGDNPYEDLDDGGAR
jgi:pyruvate dehydrogenase E1 component alpha subunit